MDAVDNYGVADLNGGTREPFKSIPLKDLVEKPSSKEAPSNLALLGRYILPSRLLDLLETTPVFVGGKIQVTDALDELLKLEELNAFETDAGIFDCGNKQGFLSANLAVRMRRAVIKDILKTMLKDSGW